MEQNGVRQSASARQEDPWRQVSPQQCLRLIVGLGVRQEEVAQSLQVPRSTLAVWLRGSRDIPFSEHSLLRRLAQATYAQHLEIHAAHLARLQALEPLLGAWRVRGLLDAAHAAWDRRLGAWRADKTTRDAQVRAQVRARLSAIGAHANQDHWSHAETATILTLCKQVLYALRTWEEPEENALQ